LVGLITGMIYGGPQLIGQLNRDLAVLLKKDGFASVSEAIGSAHSKSAKT
jgi:dihydroorotate dehydrogenase